MRYEIESKNDLSGAQLVIRFPEEELDQTALYTIQADPPLFLVPFRYRNIDGQVECTYHLGGRSKLQYRYGKRTPEEYVQFWQKVLTPLLDCDDWFLKPLSFALDTKYLYWEKESDAVSYLYVPSRTNCVEPDALREMVIELSRQNSVTDANLENKVLRALMQQFQPKAFLEMLRASRPGLAQENTPKVQHTSQSQAQSAAVSAPPVQPELPAQVQQPASFMPASAPKPAQSGEGDIVIRLDDASGGAPQKGKGFSFFSGKKEKKQKESGKKSGLFGKKEKKPKEILLGAAEDFPSGQEPIPSCSPQAAEYVSVWSQSTEDCEVTQIMEEEQRTCLRLVGDPTLPREILVDLAPGQAFTIGRFDVSVGHRQSNFEFDKQTKAVSRHHAALEREMDGSYALVDLNSKAGTFLDGERLTPNVPKPLTRGSRISFGTGGADYVWEE